MKKATLTNPRNRRPVVAPGEDSLREIAFLQSTKVHLRQIGYTLDLTMYPRREQLMAAFCEVAWRKAELRAAWKIGGVRKLSKALYYFNAFLEEKRPAIASTSELDEDAMLEWRQWVISASLSAATKEQYYQTVNHCLAVHRRQHPDSFAAEFRIPKFPATFGPGPRGNKRDPYDEGVLTKIREAAERGIRGIVRRLNRGKELVAKGTPLGEGERAPKSHWLKGENVLWWIVHRLGGRIYPQRATNIPNHNRVRSMFARATHRPRLESSIRNPSEAYTLLYPTSMDMAIFAISLFSFTGVADNIQPILDLKINDLSKLGDSYLARLTKNRPKAKSYVARWKSVAGLIETILEITAPLREIADESVRDRLWIFYEVAPRGGLAGGVNVLTGARLAIRAKEWAERNGIPNFQVSRFRPTELSRRYSTRGNLASVQDVAKHSLVDTTVGYVNNPATVELHASAIENAQRRAFTELSAIPIVVDKPPKATRTELSEVHHLATTAAERLSDGREDVFFNGCADFYNAPGGEKDTPCDRPFACLLCTNSIYLKRHAPLLIALREHLKRKRESEEEIVWNHKFGGIYHVLCNQILPQYSAETIAWAEREATKRRFYIPVEL